MARKKKDSAISGLLGESVIIRRLRGRIVVTAIKPRKKKTTPKRALTLSRFEEASKWAKSQMRIPEIKEMYRARVTKKKHNPHMVALTDYMLVPKVESIDVTQYRGQPGDVIEIKATDDFRVERVHIDIKRTDGTSIEYGDAQQSKENSDFWKYTVTTKNPELQNSKIIATALDRPRNMGISEVVIGTPASG